MNRNHNFRSITSLAGSIFMLRNPMTFNGEVNGLGFLAVAILIIGSWKMPLVIISSIVLQLSLKYLIQIVLFQF